MPFTEEQIDDVLQSAGFPYTNPSADDLWKECVKTYRGNVTMRQDGIHTLVTAVLGEHHREVKAETPKEALAKLWWVSHSKEIAEHSKA